MPDDTIPVSYGRWQEAHRALEERVGVIETELRRSNWAVVDQQVSARLDAIDSRLRELQDAFADFTEKTAEAIARRRDRQWTLMVAFLTGLALPLAVLAVTAAVYGH